MPIPPTEGQQAAVSLLHSLAEPTRLRIVQRLQRGECRVRDLVDELGLAQSTISEHVACLRDCGLVTGRAEGRQLFYSLSHPELTHLLEAVEVLLQATGFKVDLCSTYGSEALA
ncbi:ArsR family transcriptional regulator [Cryobacterium cheniae]|uniref:ArsR family transcriptional regulator n=1 Tax=Cryobacterium cheniae TaxID=1259262 RepID=A0A4R8XI32_9MICO|nr:metalloregulator ArsR/SmtB family transcription factor [Cryobacterium cheniae]TFC77099.1 ArsR family transcriptional regulator [Cryobacterium cheniae]